MHVALTGISGFIGSAVARHLKERGHTVAGLVRATSRTDHLEPWADRLIVGAQDDRSTWPDLLDGADCVIHNAVDWQILKKRDLAGHLQSNLVAAIELLHAAGERQFVYMSSIAVHHDMRPRWNGVVDEDHPMRPAGLYGACKAAVEVHGWAHHFATGAPFCALRPCAVYGVDPRRDRSIGYPLIARLRETKRFDRAGGGKFVHVDDVAALAAAAVGHERAKAGVFNVVDCYARWADIAQMVADALGIDAEIDFSSPAKPKNEFTKDAMAELGVVPDRGHEGLRAYVRELVERLG